MIGLSLKLSQIQMLLLIFVRVAAIVFSAPLFDSRAIPVLFKVGLALSAAVLLYPLLVPGTPMPADGFTLLGFGIVGEALVGLIIGFAVRLIFAAVEMAGQLAGFQMGLAIANVFDPVTSTQMPIIAQMENIIAMLLFLAVNAHYLVIRALAESFRLVPLLGFRFSGSLMTMLSDLTGGMFVTAVKIAAPVMVALLLTSLTLGLVARVVPQMNIFIVAMPIKIIIGLVFLALALPFLAGFMGHVFVNLGNDLVLMLRAMK
jgi:flagellar biosynthetic protein FliR